MIKTSTLQFFKSLKKNNNKAWFELHRGEYETAKANMIAVMQQAIDKHGKKDKEIAHIAAKDTMFRINRDVRFSKDKSPYKTHFGAALNKGGRKGQNTAGYYFHMEPGKSFIGGGIWMPDPAFLSKVRQEIDYNLKELESVLKAKKFKTIYGSLSDDKEYKLSRVPKGYEADNPAAEYLKLKSYIAMTEISDAELTSPKLVSKIVSAMDALQPLLMFLNRSVEE